MNALFKIIPNSLEANHFMWRKFSICLSVAGCINFFVYIFDISSAQSVIRWIIFTFCISLIIYIAFDVSKLVFTLTISPLTHNRKENSGVNIPSVLIALFLCHTLSLASSSFIEEEHQTWYYLTSSLLIYLTLKHFCNDMKSVWNKHTSVNSLSHSFWNIRSIIVVMLSIIGCRRLNQTGDKWRHIVDIGDVLSRNENHIYLTLTFLIGLILLLLQLKKFNSSLEMLFCFIALFCVFVYRQMKNYSFLVLLFFWISLVCTQLRHCRSIFCQHRKFGYETKENLVQLLEANLTCVFVISALLHRPHNVILLPALMYTLQKTYYLCDNLYIKNKRLHSRYYVLVLKTTTTTFIANMFYFFQGNSNSLATIDLNPGFIGLSSYNPFVAGLQITLNTYCAPINAFLYLMWHMFFTQRNNLPLRQEKEQISNVQLMETTEEDLYLVYNLFTASVTMPVAVYWCLLVGFRYHLFIYSVFAPKAFYEFFHLFVFYINFILINLYFMLFLK